jgi:alpha-L-fucosidase
MKYEPTKQSLKNHKVPNWFNDAKLGIFIHWGLFSVPAFAITGIDINESMKRGFEEHYKNNPYAEWYLNSLRIPGSPTQAFHKENYGEDFSYDDFVPIFNNELKKMEPRGNGRTI